MTRLAPTDAVDPVSIDVVLRRASAGLPCWVGDQAGGRRPVPIGRWMGGVWASTEDRRADRAVLNACRGPTLDVGCGPGRFTAGLARLGLEALGVDTSATAVELTIDRGGAALQRDVFAPLPGRRHWARVLLVDGNIGIGGDPLRVLRRARELLTPDGVVIAEVDPSTRTGLHVELRRWETETLTGNWFQWASVGLGATGEVAHAAGLRVSEVVETSGRYFVRMVRDRL
ncbi:methyltransferase domain-containing protein [Nocardiaceae bacterium NPDC056970]